MRPTTSGCVIVRPRVSYATVERGLRKITRTYQNGPTCVTWQVRLVDSAGSTRHHGTFASKTAARRALVDARAAVRDGSYPAPAAARARFKDVADHWLATRTHLTQRTRQTDRLVITGKLTTLHNVRMARLDYDMLVGFQTRLADAGLAPGTQRRIMYVVSAVCADASRRRLIGANPCLDLPKIKSRKPQLTLPEPYEVERLITHLSSSPTKQDANPHLPPRRPAHPDVQRAHRSRGGRTDAATCSDASPAGRTDAATPKSAAGSDRTNRGRVAARIRHDREFSTDRPPPPPPPQGRPSHLDPAGPDGGGGDDRSRRPPRSVGDRSAGADALEHWHRRHKSLLAGCGITNSENWDDYVAQVHQTRRAAGQPLTRWSAAHQLTAFDLAVRGRGWPAEHTANALLHVAADPATRSPARLAEAGPWWDPPDPVPPAEPQDLSALEAELDAVGGMRVQLQRAARGQLAAERRTLTRATVVTRAGELLRARGDD